MIYRYFAVTVQFSNGEAEDVTDSNRPVEGEIVQIGKNRGKVHNVVHEYDQKLETHHIFVYATII